MSFSSDFDQMSSGYIVKRIFQLIQQNPRIIGVIILGGIFELIQSFYHYETLRAYYSALINRGELPPINTPSIETLYAFNPLLLLTEVIEFIFLVLSSAWIIVTLKSLKNKSGEKKSYFPLKQTMIYIPRLVLGALLFFIFLLLTKLYIDYINNLEIEIISILSAIIFFIILFLLFPYTGAAIVFDDVNILEGFKRSSNFTNEFKTTTLGFFGGTLLLALAIGFCGQFLVYILTFILENRLNINVQFFLVETTINSTPFYQDSINWVSVIFNSFLGIFLVYFLLLGYSWIYGRFSDRSLNY